MRAFVTASEATSPAFQHIYCAYVRSFIDLRGKLMEEIICYPASAMGLFS